MSWLFSSVGQSIGASTSASVLPMNSQGWFPLGLTGLISLRVTMCKHANMNGSDLPCRVLLRTPWNSDYHLPFSNWGLRGCEAMILPPLQLLPLDMNMVPWCPHYKGVPRIPKNWVAWVSTLVLVSGFCFVCFVFFFQDNWWRCWDSPPGKKNNLELQSPKYWWDSKCWAP